MEATLNISANLRAIDTIKSEILAEMARLYKSLSEYSENDSLESVTECIATVIAMDYILARRTGISFREADEKISELLSVAIENNHELEVVFSDMSDLKNYINSR